MRLSASTTKIANTVMSKEKAEVVEATIIEPEDSKVADSQPLEVVPMNQSMLVMPIVSATEALKQWESYLDLKKAIAVKEDIQMIKGKEFLKKSYWP